MDRQESTENLFGDPQKSLQSDVANALCMLVEWTPADVGNKKPLSGKKAKIAMPLEDLPKVAQN